MINIDELSVVLSKSLVDGNLVKKVAMPPILYYKLRALMRKLKPQRKKIYGFSSRSSQAATPSTPISITTKSMAELISQKIEEHIILRELQKNEMVASIFDSGVLKFDFGSKVPEKIKKMALAWAKSRGLNPIEASLQKSKNNNSSIICGLGSSSPYLFNCTKRVKYAIREEFPEK